MQAADRGTLSGIHGPVASLMTTDPQYTVALEIALGAALQNIVVDRDTDAKEAIAFLKRRDAGRATFLPMSAIRGDMLREPHLAQEYGFVGIASQLVTYDARYDGIFQNLLGRTVVVEDLDCGARHSAAGTAGSRQWPVTAAQGTNCTPSPGGGAAPAANQLSKQVRSGAGSRLRTGGYCTSTTRRPARGSCRVKPVSW